MVKVFKRIGLIVSSLILCVATVFGLMNINSNKKVVADDTSVTTSSLFTLGNGVTETIGKTYGTNKVVGYEISNSDSNANKVLASFNGVFNDDLTLEYYLPDPNKAATASGQGVHFVVEDVNGNALFNVARRNESSTAGATSGWQGKMAYYVYNTDATSSNKKKQTSWLPVIGGDYTGASYGYKTGKIQLVWTETGVTINATNSDGTLTKLYDYEGKTKPVDGYRIKIKASNYGYPANVVLTNVNGVSLAGETVESTLQGEISYVGETLVDEVPTIALSAGESLGQFTAIPCNIVGGMTLPKGEAVNFSYNEDFSVKDAGTHSIDVTYGVSVKTYNVVVKTMADTSSLFTLGNGVTETIGKTYGTNKVVGYEISNSDSKANKVLASFNGVFNDDLTLEYYLPDPNKEATAVGQGVHFVVEDTNGNALFSVARKNKNSTATTTSGWRGRMAYYVYADDTNDDAVKIIETEMHPVIGADYTGTGYAYSTGKIQLTWTDTGVTISATNKNNVLTEIYSYAGKTKPVDGYTIKIRAAKAGYPANVVLANVNGVSLAGETVEGEVSGDAKAIRYPEAINGEIVLSQGNTFGEFKATRNWTIGDTWNVDAEETFKVADDYSSQEIGEYTLSVNKYNYTQDFAVRVIYKTVEDLALEMAKGASVRIGKNDNKQGLRFTMTLDGYTDWMDSIGENNYYTSVKFGMFIMPADYVDTYGDYTLDNLFGDKAIYTWAGKEGEAGTTQIRHGSDSQMYYDTKEGVWAAKFSITDIHTTNLDRDFIGVGYVEVVRADGTVERKLASYFQNNADNNVRSIYEVAVAAYNDEQSELTGDEKLWLKQNYIDVVEQQ